MITYEVNGKYGLKKSNGEIIVPAKYDDLSYGEKLTAVKLNPHCSPTPQKP